MQINYHHYFNHTGYSIAAQEYILSMLSLNPELDIKVTYINTPVKDGISDNRRQLFASLRQKHDQDRQIHIFHSIPVKYARPKKSHKNIGICVYETIEPPKEWVDAMNTMDEIITASTFNKSIFENSGVKVPIHVIPHCFDSKMFNDSIKAPGRYNLTTFFSLGTFKTRKNWESLIKAWYDTFEHKDNVCLLIKTDKPDDLAKLVVSVKTSHTFRTKKTASIYTEREHRCNFEDIPKIMRKGDIYISTSLGEGFGYGGLHAMALGMPTIVPKFGGCLEYAKPGLCKYIEPKQYRRIPTMDGIPQFMNKIWPVLSLNDIKESMRYAYDKRNEFASIAQSAYKYVHEYFSYSYIGQQMLKVLST